MRLFDSEHEYENDQIERCIDYSDAEFDHNDNKDFFEDEYDEEELTQINEMFVDHQTHENAIIVAMDNFVMFSITTHKIQQFDQLAYRSISQIISDNDILF